jgi:hypothetical protein
MSHRSLRIRAFLKSEDIIPRLSYTNPRPTRNSPNSGHGDQTNIELESNRERWTKELRDLEDEVKKLRADHGLFPVPVDTNQPAAISGPGELCESSTKPTIHATYSRSGLSEPLILPKLCAEWASTRQQKTLRLALVEAASNRLQRRSQVISQVMRSEVKLKLLKELLFPYQRRPPKWERNLYKLLHFADSAQRAERDIPSIEISPFTDDWINDLYQARYTINATEFKHLYPPREEFHDCKSSPDLREDWQLQQVFRGWMHLLTAEKLMRWPHIMLKFLAVSTEQALAFLLVTNVTPFPSFESVMDVLLHLKSTRNDEINSRPELRDRYLHILSQQRQPTRWLHQIEKGHLELFLEECSGDECARLFEDFQGANIDISYLGLLRFMDHFIKDGDVDRALKALNAIDLDIRLQPEQQLLSRCTNLLKLDSITSDGPSPNFRILPQLLEAGVKPNLILHNLMLKNAVNLGASVVAWDLYRYLRDHDLPTDARTYMVLMKDALARRDEEGLRELLTTINTRTDLLGDPYLTTCILTLIRVHGRQSRVTPSIVFSKMLEVYSRTFTIVPLKHLGLLRESTWSNSSLGQPHPEIGTLAFVVQSYVLAQQSSAVVQSLLDRIEYLRLEGDKLALALTRCLPFYDGFIVFFARTTETLPNCLKVLQLMLDRKVQPSATTWGSIALAFEKNGQFQAAEDVKKMMYRQGLTMELPLHRKRGVSDSAEAALAHRSNGVPVANQSPARDAEQEDQFEEQEFKDAVDDTAPSADLQHCSVPECQQSSSLDISGCSNLIEQSAGYTDDVTQLQAKHSALISPGQREGQTADNWGRHVLQGQENQKDAPVPKPSMFGSFKQVIEQMNEDQLDILMLDRSLLSPRNASPVQQGNPPLPSPLNQPASTSESNPPYADDFDDGFIRDTYPDRHEITANNTSHVATEASDLFFTGLISGTGDEVSSDLVRTTEAQQITEQTAEGRTSREPDGKDVECKSNDDRRRTARNKQPEDNGADAEKVSNSATKRRVSKVVSLRPRMSRRSRKYSLPFVRSPAAVLENLNSPKLELRGEEGSCQNP